MASGCRKAKLAAIEAANCRDLGSANPVHAGGIVDRGVCLISWRADPDHYSSSRFNSSLVSIRLLDNVSQARFRIQREPRRPDTPGRS